MSNTTPVPSSPIELANGPSQTLSFKETVRERHSVRSFLPTPVPDAVLRSVLEDAQRTPSNCNTQPWQVHIVSGATRDALSKALLADDEAGRMTPDFSFSTADFCGVYSERSKAQGAAYYQAIGVACEATEDRLARDTIWNFLVRRTPRCSSCLPLATMCEWLATSECTLRRCCCR